MAKKKTVTFSTKIYSDRAIAAMQARIDLLGYKKKYDAVTFLNIRILSAAFLFFMILYLFDAGFFLGPVISFFYYQFLPVVFIDIPVKKRGKELDKQSIYFFEVLTLSLESGRNLKNALEMTTGNIDSDLSDEFKYLLEEMRYGKSLDEALEELKRRIPSDTINNIILNIAQSNIFGNSIIETLHNQIDYAREKEILDTKAQISKIPIKISVISVVFFIPIMILLILSPIIISLITG